MEQICKCGASHDPAQPRSDKCLGPRVTRFDVNAAMLVEMLIPVAHRFAVRSVRATDRPGFGEVVTFEIEHECIDIPAGYVSLSFREITAIGGARVSIFNAADSVAEPVYQRAPYETPKLEAAYKARELLELFKACTPEERACVLDYLDADPRPARTNPVDVLLDHLKATGAELAPDAEAKFAEMRAHADEMITEEQAASERALPPGVQLVEPLTEEQAALVAAIVEDGIAYARRFFGDDVDFAAGGAVGDGSLFSHPAGASLMGESGPEAIVPSGRRYTFTHDATQAARLDRLKDWPDGPCGSCGGRDEVHAKDCAIFEWSVGDAPEPGRVEIVKAATEACAHRFVRTGFDPDGPLVVCADCGAPIKRMGVVVTGTAGDPIDAAAVSRAIAKSG